MGEAVNCYSLFLFGKGNKQKKLSMRIGFYLFVASVYYDSL